MSKFAEEKFVSSGIYNIINVKHGTSIVRSQNDNGRLTASRGDDNFEWSVTLLADKKWIIQSRASGFSVDLAPQPEAGSDILLQPGHHQPHSWIIKRQTRAPALNSYIIYSASQPGLIWSQPYDEEGTPLELLRDDSKPSSWWKFRIVGYAEAPAGGDLRQDSLAMHRPTHIGTSVIRNKATIIIPPGWLTTISAVSIGKCINLVRVDRVWIMDRMMEKHAFVSPWESSDQAMVIKDKNMCSYDIPAIDQPSAVVFEFFHSKNRHRRDPVLLPVKRDLSTDLRIASMARPDNMRVFPDFQTFWIFDESPVTSKAPTVGPTNNALVIVHSTKNENGINLSDPGNPTPGTTNPGFNDILDMPRPSTMDEYLGNYHTIFVVDDSSSMRGPRWAEVRLALTELSKEAMQYDADGIEICFMNSRKYKESIKDPAELLEIFDTIQPRGWTYPSAKLKYVLNRIIKELDDAVGKPNYANIKPVDVMVITDMAPTDEPAAVIEEAIQHLDLRKHHLNAVGIQFVQIGDEDGAEAALKRLKECPFRRMVDVVPYKTALTPQRLSEVLLGSLHPSIRTALAQKASTSFRKCPHCRSEDIPEFEYPPRPPTTRCQHKPLACRKCLQQYIAGQIFSQTIVFKINCPTYSCVQKLGYDEIKLWASNDCFERYNSEKLRNCLAKDINFVWCLNMECDHGQTHPHGHGYPIVQCSWCYKKSCFTHKLPWHEGLTCAEFDSTRPDAVGQKGFQEIIAETTQPCPKCKYRIKRSAGCDYMTCRCGHGFCWRCQVTTSQNGLHQCCDHLPTCPRR